MLIWTQKVLQAMGIVFPCQLLLLRVRLEISIIYRAWRLKLEGSESIKFHIRYAMCFLKVKDGHLTILPTAPFIHSGQSFQTVKNKSVMVCTMTEIFRKYILTKKKKKRQEWSLIQSLLWAQVSQLTFIYLLRLAITPYWP